jgi:hypothetical protein
LPNKLNHKNTMNTQTKPGATKFIATNKHAIAIASSTFHGRPDLGWLNLGDKARRLALEIEAAMDAELAALRECREALACVEAALNQNATFPKDIALARNVASAALAKCGGAK